MDVVQPLSCTDPEPLAAPEPTQALRVKLRELVWRMDQVAEQLRTTARTIDDQTLALVLDTSDAKALLTGGADVFR
ncbi:MAG: hypothetical protein ACK4JY_07230 [Brevundimonas sp.]|uniref:hypothetical protein n=1 Tax=Brevundimonas sp. TaxID=1871086 RepID=UPI00391CAC4B